MKIYIGKSLGRYFGKQAMSFVLAGTLVSGVGVAIENNNVDVDSSIGRATYELDNGIYYDEDVKNNLQMISDRIVGVDTSKAKTYEKVRTKDKLNINRNLV